MSMLPPPRADDLNTLMPPPNIEAGVITQRSVWKRPLKHTTLLWALALVCAAWTAGLLGVYVGAKINRTNPSTNYRNSTQAVVLGTPRDAAFNGRLDVAAVTERLRPSVVAVSSDITDKTGGGEGVGTGVVLTADGQILTNAHVVEGATEVRVRLAGERDPRPAKVLARDTGNDLALLSVDVTGLVPATFADPGNVRVGDEVIAIGFALDLDGEASVTLGIISALDRTVLTEAGALDGMIQTDAAISSGNSGGALVNAAGEVVGINTAVARSDATNIASNIGFSISMAQVLPEIDVLRAQASGVNKGQGFLGVGLGERIDGGRGAVVTGITEGSPAADAGIKIDDIVVELDGVAIDGAAGLIAGVRDHSPGDVITIGIERAGAKQTFTLVLVERTATTG